jgi:hypothetical protein
MISGDQEHILREFIDFVNLQVGVYMDAIAGFEGHTARTEKQVHRISRAQSMSTSEAGFKTVVCTSYEDPSQPDVIHNRIVRTVDYLAANAESGINYQQHSWAILVFLFTFWEDEYRPRLSSVAGVPLSDVRSDIMGDLRILRNSILHHKGLLTATEHGKLRVIRELFQPGLRISVPYEHMHRIFGLVKQEIASRLMPPGGPVAPSDVRDVAIQGL